MENPPDISVIVPHLNQPDALRGLVEALDAQDFTGQFELIIADNGSRLPLPAETAERPNTRIIVETTPGPGPARSAGARIARARLLSFTDCDCRPDPQWLSAIWDHFQSPENAPAVAGDVRILFQDASRPNALEAYEAIYGYRQKLYVDRDGFAATCNFAVNSNTFAKIGPFSGLEVAEDREWGQRATAQGVSFAYLPAAVIRTPARSDFSELKRKWDRHIGHDFAARSGFVSWVARAAAITLSPIGEIPRIVSSDRITGFAPKARAFATLVRIRTYRGATMMRLAFGGRAENLTARWRE